MRKIFILLRSRIACFEWGMYAIWLSTLCMVLGIVCAVYITQIAWASTPTVTLTGAIFLDGYMNATEDDAGVAVGVTANEWATMSVAFSDGSDTVTKTGVMSGATYAEQLSDTMSGLSLSNSDDFGYSVARDGDMLVVGAIGDDGNGGTHQGAVYLIKDSDADGSFADASAQDVTVIDGSTNGITLTNNSFFGSAVAIDDDMLVIGMSTHDSGKGRVYLIDDGGDEWKSVQASDVTTIQSGTAGISLDASDWFGAAVAIDGDILVVGAYGDDSGGTDRGAIYIIDDGTDNDFSTLSAFDVTKFSNTSSNTVFPFADNDAFGSSVALNNGVLAVGLTGDDTGGTNKGAVYLIDDGADNDFDTLAAGDVTRINSSTNGISLSDNDLFGSSVAMTNGMLAIGATGDDTGGTNRGAVYLIREGGDGWESVITGDVMVIDNALSSITLANNDNFGSTVAIDGGTLAVGAPYDDTGGTNRGAVYMFNPTFEATLTGNDFEQDSTPTNGDSKLAEGSITVTATATDIAGNKGTGTKKFIYDPTAPTISGVVHTGPSEVIVDVVMSEDVYGTVDADDFVISGGGNPTVSNVLALGSTKSNVSAAFTLILNKVPTTGATIRYRQDANTSKRIKDVAGNILASSASMNLLDPLNATVGAIPVGDAQSKTIPITGVTTGAAAKYKLITSLSCNATTYAAASNEQTVTLSSGSGSATISSDGANGKYLCLQVSKAGGYTEYIRSGIITGIDTTNPTMTGTPVSGGYVNAAEDDHTMVVSANVSSDTSSLDFIISDGTDTLATKSGIVGGTFKEKLHTTIGNRTLRSGAEFGAAVSRDGNILAVGVPANAINRKGAVYIITDHDNDDNFSDSGTTVRVLDDTISGLTLSNYDNFGRSVHLSGNTLVVGAAGHASYRGAVFIITDTDNDKDWTDGGASAVQIIRSGAPSGITLATADYFGSAVHKRDNLLVVSANGDDTGGTNRGAVYILTDHDRNGIFNDSTTTVQEINNGHSGITLGNDDYFGSALTLYRNILAIGAPDNDTGGTGRGAVFLLADHDGDNDWTDSGTTVKKVHTALRNGSSTHAIANGEKIGSSLALIGGKLYIGSRTSNASRGAVYLLIDIDADADWTDAGTTLTKLHESPSVHTPESGDQYGVSLSVTDDGIIVGASYDDDGATDAGAVYRYDHTARTTLTTGEFEKDTTPTAGDGKLAAGTVTVTMQATDKVGNTDSGTTSFVYDPGIPTLTIATVSGGYVNASEDDDGVTISGTTTNADSGTLVDLRLTNGSNAVIISDVAVSSNTWSTTLSLANLTTLTEGTISIEGTVHDSAENTSTATQSFMYDTSIPAANYTISNTGGVTGGATTYLNNTDTISVGIAFDEPVVTAPIVQMKNKTANFGSAITATADANPPKIVYSNTISGGDSGGTHDPFDFGEPGSESGIVRETHGTGFVYKTTKAFGSLYIGASGNFNGGAAFLARTDSSRPIASTFRTAGTEMWSADSHGGSDTVYGGKLLTNVASGTYFWFYASGTRTMTNRDIVIAQGVDADAAVNHDNGGQTGSDTGSTTDPFDFGTVSSVAGIEREALGSGYVYKTSAAFRKLYIATKSTFTGTGTYYARRAATKPTTANMTTHGTQLWVRGIVTNLSGATILSNVPANTYFWFYPSANAQVSNRDLELKGMHALTPYQYPYIATYTVSSPDTVAVGDLKYDITNESALQDVAGNYIADRAATTITGYGIDTTIPTVSSVKSEGTTLTVALSEKVLAESTPDTSDFTITGGGAPSINAISGLAGSAAGASTVFTLELASALNGSATLSYTQNSSSNAKRVKDPAGNLLASFSSTAIGTMQPATLTGAPTGTNNTTTLSVSVGGTDMTHYKQYLIPGNKCSSEVFVANYISNDTTIGGADGVAVTNTHFYLVYYGGTNNDTAYAYTHKGVRDSAADINLAATNQKSVGAVADSTHLYVLESDFANSEYKVYAYNLSTGARDTSKEFTLDSSNDGANGITKTATHFYVLEDGEGSVYAYATDGTRASGNDIDSLPNTRGSGMTADNTNLYVLSKRFIYVYALSDRSHTKTINVTKTGILQGSDSVGGFVILDNYFYIPNNTRNALVYAAEPSYSAETPVATTITDSLATMLDGPISLCVIGKDSSTIWQRTPTRASWVKETIVPTVVSVAYKDAASNGSDLASVIGTDEIYSVVLFSETLAETAGDGSAARPKIVYRIGSSGTETQYDIITSGSLASGDCIANGDKDVYTCRYDTDGSDDGNFKSYVTTYTDPAGNNGAAQGYDSLNGAVTIYPTLTATITIPAGSAQSKDIAISNVTSGAAVTYKIISTATCNSTNYTAATGSESTLTVSNTNTGSVTVSSESDNGKHLCLKLTRTGSTTAYVGSSAIAGIDTTVPTIATTIGGTNDNRTVSATDNEVSTTMKYKIITGSTSCNATTMSSGTTTYTEGNDITIAAADNGKKVCFSSTDAASNTGYWASAVLTTAAALTATVGSVPSGSAQSKDIAVSSVTVGATVKYKIVSNATCNATNYGSGGTTVSLASNAGTVTVTNESDNNKYLCFKVTKTNFSDRYFGSAQITGIDDTAPTVTSPTFTTSNSNASYAKQGDTITISIDFSEEIDEGNTTIKYQIGSGTESTFTYTTDATIDSGECKETTDSTDIYSCKYTIASGDTGRFKTKVSAFKDSAGNSGTAQSYNSTGITVDTTTPSKPTSLDLASNDDTGSSNTDNITKTTDDLTITGCAEANSTVEIFKDDASFSTPVTDTADTTHASCTGGTKRFSANIDLCCTE